MEETNSELVVADAPASVVTLGSLRGRDAAQLVQSASTLATTLAQIINDRGLYKNIQGKNYVFAEGWTTLSMLCGLMPREVACENVGEGVYVAVVSLVRISDGVEMTRASAECGGMGDETWQSRAAYARRSMAITRATGKVCRIALSWIMNLAGFAPTPLEEMEQAEREIAARAQKTPVPEKPLPKKRNTRETAGDTQDVRTGEPPAVTEPAWFGELLGIGKFGEKSWREMSQGGLGGGRHKWLDWATTVQPGNEQEDAFKERCKIVLRDYYLAREANEGKF